MRTSLRHGFLRALVTTLIPTSNAAGVDPDPGGLPSTTPSFPPTPLPATASTSSPAHLWLAPTGSFRPPLASGTPAQPNSLDSPLEIEEPPSPYPAVGVCPTGAEPIGFYCRSGSGHGASYYLSCALRDASGELITSDWNGAFAIEHIQYKCPTGFVCSNFGATRGKFRLGYGKIDCLPGKLLQRKIQSGLVKLIPNKDKLKQAKTEDEIEEGAAVKDSGKGKAVCAGGEASSRRHQRPQPYPGRPRRTRPRVAPAAVVPKQEETVPTVDARPVEQTTSQLLPVTTPDVPQSCPPTAEPAEAWYLSRLDSDEDIPDLLSSLGSSDAEWDWFTNFVWPDVKQP